MWVACTLQLLLYRFPLQSWHCLKMDSCLAYHPGKTSEVRLTAAAIWTSMAARAYALPLVMA